MDEREHQIDEAHEKTFQWIMDAEGSSEPTDKTLPLTAERDEKGQTGERSTERFPGGHTTQCVP